MQFRYVVQLASCTTGEMKIDFKGDYLHSHAWVERLTARPVVKVLESFLYLGILHATTRLG